MHNDGSNQDARFKWRLAYLMPVLYFLSVGPMCWIRNALPMRWYYRMDDLLGVLYSPLIFVCDYSERFDEWLDWYAELL